MPSLGHDLASIRKDLNLSIEDVHQSTKIPTAILESIEDDSIFTTLNENQTYIRSYIRSYARALKIDDNRIIRALDQNEAGNYSGFLRPQQEPGLSKSESSDSKKKKPDTEKEEGNNHPGESSLAEEYDNESAQDQRISSPPTVNSVDWADMGRKFIPLQTKSRMWITLTFLVLVIAAAGSFVVYQNYVSNSGSDSQVTSNSSPAEVNTPTSDSLQLNFISPAGDSVNQAGTSETALKALPDTLQMVIYAAYGVLEPVRVYTDVMNSLNPYWIEHGDAYRFEFVNIIRIRGQYSRMVLLLNGHAIENFRQRFLNPETGMLEIERSIFESDPMWLQPAPDSLNIDAPPPSVIKERPSFN